MNFEKLLRLSAHLLAMPKVELDRFDMNDCSKCALSVAGANPHEFFDVSAGLHGYERAHLFAYSSHRYSTPTGIAAAHEFARRLEAIIKTRSSLT